MSYCRFFSKTILLLSLLLTFICLAEARGTVLTEIYQYDYELINRTVLVFADPPSFRIQQLREEQKIVITLTGVKRHDFVALNQNFISPVLRSINIKEEKNRLIVTINTHKPTNLRYFSLRSPDHKLVLDIYNKLTPETLHEKYLFAKFFYSVSFFNRAEPLFKEVIAASPEKTGVNYYLGMLLLRKSDTKGAVDKFARVSYRDDEYLRAQAQLMALGYKDTVFTDESEAAFVFYRDIYLRAGTLNRQKLLIALASSVNGESNITKDHLQRVDFYDPLLQETLYNIEKVRLDLIQDENLAERLTKVIGTPARYSFPMPWYLLVILTAFVTALLMFIARLLTNSRNSTGYNNHDSYSSFSVSSEAKKDELTEKHEPETVTTGDQSELVQDVKESDEPVVEQDDEHVQEPEQSSETVEKEEEGEEEKEKDEGIKDDLKPSAVESEHVQSKLILHLHQAGWDNEAIAKELSIEVSDVEKVLETLNWS